jgi:hypothetical protein
MTGNIIPNAQFELKGGKKIGISPTEPFDIYAYEDTNLETGSDGKKSFSDMSLGSYFFTFKNPTDQYKFIRMGEISDQKNQFNIPADSNLDVPVLLADKAANSLLATVVEEKIDDPLNPIPIFDAKVQLDNDLLNYHATLYTNKFGQAYFPDNSTPLEKTTYDLKVTADGYGDFSGTKSIDGLNDAVVTMIPS